MSVPTKTDVVVIGGGPTGSVSAAELVIAGHDVVLFEKAEHPREMVGESLIPDFWKFTDRIGATQKIEDAGFIKKAGAIVTWNGRRRAHTFGDFGYTRPALHVERDRFDEILFRHAAELGVSAHENMRVAEVSTGVTDDGDEWARVHATDADGRDHEVAARLVIDASGQAGVISRQQKIRHIDDAFRYLAIWGYYEGSHYVGIDGEIHTTAELDEHLPVTSVTALGGDGEAGWSWHILLRESTSVGLVIPLTHVKDVRQGDESWDEFFERRVRENPTLSKLLVSAHLIPGSVRTIRDYSSRSEALSGPGFLLAGDAAGFVDPIFSVGVVLGMYSGSAAAWAADRILVEPTKADGVRKLYDHQLDGRIEVARSLALPRYRTTGEVSDKARTAVQLERSAVKELMYVVSSFTTRSDNWIELVGGEPPELHEGQLREYDSA